MKPLFVLRDVFVRLPLLATILLVAACGRSDDARITVYRIPKETQPEQAAQQAGMTTNPAPAEVHWTAPSGWEEQPATGFRKGSFLIHGADGKTADVSVISFPEAAGGLLANVNRWRNQLKLAPVSDITQAGSPMSVAGRDMFFVDLASEQPINPDGSKVRILGGIFPINGETWFFKMMGPDQLVESQRDGFKQFLESVHLTDGSSAATGAAPASAPMSASVGGNNTNAPTPPMIAPSQGAPLQYRLPPGWREKPLTPMRLASFNAAAPNGKETDVSVVSLPGIAGGDLANVNRWRGQVNLGPIDENTLAKTAEHVKSNGHDFLMVDLVSGTPIGPKQEKQRILAAILDENERSWFIKMTGEDAAVESQKSAFTSFLQGLKIP
ncbi:MAG: hypothetical protein ACREIF_14560 [Chthoniobacterales bacterium]